MVPPRYQRAAFRRRVPRGMVFDRGLPIDDSIAEAAGRSMAPRSNKPASISARNRLG